MTMLPIIQSLRVRPVLAPMPRPLRPASGAIPAAPLVLIDVQTDQDVIGRAYIFCYTSLVLKPLCSFLDDLASLIVGKPVETGRIALFEAETAKLLDAPAKIISAPFADM